MYFRRWSIAIAVLLPSLFSSLKFSLAFTKLRLKALVFAVSVVFLQEYPLHKAYGKWIPQREKVVKERQQNFHHHSNSVLHKSDKVLNDLGYSIISY